MMAGAMKVTVVAGGVPTEQNPVQGIFEYSQAKALSAAGMQVSYLALDFRKWSEKRHLGLKRLDRDGIHIYHFSIPTGVYRRGLWLLQRLALRLYCLIEKEQGRQDIVHTHFYSIGAICSLIPRRTGVRMVATEHSSKLNKPLSDISKLDQKLARTAYANADTVIAVSECLARMLHTNFGVRPVVVGDIVNPEFALAARVPHTGFNILSVGRLVPGKRFDDLIRAFAKAELSDATLTIVGDGPLRKPLQQLVADLGMDSRIRLFGGATSWEIISLMGTTDLFALLSESETFGVAYAEALTAGIPVLATKCGGPEGFINKENGVLVDIGDTDAAARAIEDMAGGILKFSEGAIKQSASEFEPLKVAEKIKDKAFGPCHLHSKNLES